MAKTRDGVEPGHAREMAPDYYTFSDDHILTMRACAARQVYNPTCVLDVFIGALTLAWTEDVLNDRGLV